MRPCSRNSWLPWKHFCPHKKYYAIDGGGFPPKALVTGERKGSQYAFTLGNGALAQPKVEQYFQDETWKYRRMELSGFSQGMQPGRHYGHA